MSKRKKLGLVFMLLGFLLVLGGGSLYLYNLHEDAVVDENVKTYLPVVKEYISEKIAQKQEETTPIYQFDPLAQQGEIDPSMTAVEIDGHVYIGVLTVPDLGMELPIQENWDEKKLTVSPCRYNGSYKTDDLVIAGHNYKSHFNPLKNVKIDTEVLFTDMDGQIHQYKVAERQIVQPTDIDEMIYGDWDLTLFTCTYGGQTRLAIRCIKQD